MPICGVLISLEHGPRPPDETLALLAQQPELTLGQRLGQQQPAVLEVQDGDHLEQAWARLQQLPGVDQLQLVYADYDNSSEQIHREDGPTS